MGTTLALEISPLWIDHARDFSKTNYNQSFILFSYFYFGLFSKQEKLKQRQSLERSCANNNVTSNNPQGLKMIVQNHEGNAEKEI
mgnify:CR=1 FL=1